MLTGSKPGVSSELVWLRSSRLFELEAAAEDTPSIVARVHPETWSNECGIEKNWSAAFLEVLGHHHGPDEGTQSLFAVADRR